MCWTTFKRTGVSVNTFRFLQDRILEQANVVLPDVKTVLLVEDNTVGRSTAVRMFERLGYKVVAYGDAVHALAAINAKLAFDHTRYDVIYIDMHLLGNMTGYQLAEKVRTTHPLAIMIVSSSTIPDPDIATFNTRFLMKPYAKRDLQQVLER